MSARVCKSLIFAASPLMLCASIVNTNGEAARLSARINGQSQVQDILVNGTNTIGNQIDNFFNQIERLSANPSDLTARRMVLNAASTLAGSLRDATGQLAQLRAGMQNQVAAGVNTVNNLTAQIADLNTRIVAAQSSQGLANDLMDQRDQLIDQLSQWMDVRTVAGNDGAVNVIGPGVTLVVGSAATTLTANVGPGGSMNITANNSPTPLSLHGGTLGGLVEQINQAMPAIQSKLDALAGTIIQQVNSVHATGIGRNGPATSMSGSWHVANTAAALDSAGLPFDVSAGQLTLTVTDTATAARTPVTINFDPTTGSLQDLVNSINLATPGQVTASIDPLTNTLQLQAQSGFAFDFADDTNSTGLLAGLGVNGLFTGSDATSINVRADILADPKLARGGSHADCFGRDQCRAALGADATHWC